MKAIDILIKTRSQITDEHQFANIYDEAIKELESLQYKLKKCQSYVIDLENQLKGKTNWWMEGK